MSHSFPVAYSRARLGSTLATYLPGSKAPASVAESAPSCSPLGPPGPAPGQPCAHAARDASTPDDRHEHGTPRACHEHSSICALTVCALTVLPRSSPPHPSMNTPADEQHVSHPPVIYRIHPCRPPRSSESIAYMSIQHPPRSASTTRQAQRDGRNRRSPGTQRSDLATCHKDSVQKRHSVAKG